MLVHETFNFTVLNNDVVFDFVDLFFSSRWSDFRTPYFFALLFTTLSFTNLSSSILNDYHQRTYISEKSFRKDQDAHIISMKRILHPSQVARTRLETIALNLICIEEMNDVPRLMHKIRL